MKNESLWFLAALAVVLVVGVFARHDSAFMLAGWTGMEPRDIFHIAGGLLEIVLLTIVVVMLCVIVTSVEDEHTRFWFLLARVACAIGIVEALLLSGCATFMTTYPPPGVTVCKHVTGLPIGFVVKILEVGAVVWVVGTYIKWLLWERNAEDEL